MPTLPCDPKLFFKTTKPDDPRLGDIVNIDSDINHLTSGSFALLGNPDDEGIKINGGRPGASFAPDTIRKYFYKMTPSFEVKKTPLIFDVGNINCAKELGVRHAESQIISSKIFSQNAKAILLGGGHDYGFPDCASFLDNFSNKKNKPLIVNFDAHFDVRPTNQGLSSGTPFYRLLEKYKNFEFVEYGIQEQCNSKIHFNWLKNKKAKVITLSQINKNKDFFKATKFISNLNKKRPTFLSIDIDVFSSAYAPGCSQSWSTGLEPNLFFNLFAELITKLDVKGIGIYEVSPQLDTDDRTSKLAAQIIYKYIFGN